MTSLKQIEANRRNARKSTGPTTQNGKERSRCNAVRHGLTAETVIGALEDAEDYSAFEATIVADYDAQSAVERELVLRLASLLWRLRRATTIETGLFDIQADHLAGIRHRDTAHSRPHQMIHSLFEPHLLASLDGEGTAARAKTSNPSTVVLTRCFLRLCNLPNYAVDRLSRYEATMWRQVAQTLVALDSLNRRKPNERRRSVRFRSLQDAEDVW
jgi:hypothetical protein